MNCPKCNESMEEVTHEGTTVDRCTGCGGLWFDAQEAEDLMDTEGGSLIDNANPVKGWQANFVRDIKCPRCDVKMKAVSDVEETIVKFEVCTECQGYFMDAGEFRDIADTEVVEATTEGLISKLKGFIQTFKFMHSTDGDDK